MLAVILRRITMNKEIFNQLKLLNKMGQEFLKKHYNPHCQIIINSDGIKITSDEIFCPKNDVVEILDKIKGDINE